MWFWNLHSIIPKSIFSRDSLLTTFSKFDMMSILIRLTTSPVQCAYLQSSLCIIWESKFIIRPFTKACFCISWSEENKVSYTGLKCAHRGFFKIGIKKSITTMISWQKDLQFFQFPWSDVDLSLMWQVKLLVLPLSCNLSLKSQQHHHSVLCSHFMVNVTFFFANLSGNKPDISSSYSHFRHSVHKCVCVCVCVCEQ